MDQTISNIISLRLSSKKGCGSIFYKNIGLNFPGETFCVLKEKEEKEFGEYRTRGRGELVTFPIIEGGRDVRDIGRD